MDQGYEQTVMNLSPLKELMIKADPKWVTVKQNEIGKHR
jgi:hypothetical protein